MKVIVLTDKKNELDVEIESVTMAEVLRVYANKAGADLAAWRRNHPTENPILHIEASNPKKVLKSAIASIEKDIDSAANEFKKLK